MALQQCRRYAIQLEEPAVAKLCNQNADLCPPHRAVEIFLDCLRLLDRRSETPNQKSLLNVAEASERFNLSKRTLYRMIQDGLPHVKARGAIRIKAADLQEYLASDSKRELEPEELFDD